MFIYLISWAGGRDYEKFDAAVVIAPDEETARDIRPKHNFFEGSDAKCELVNWKAPNRNHGWAMRREDVVVTLLGCAPAWVPISCVSASFNPG